MERRDGAAARRPGATPAAIVDDRVLQRDRRAARSCDPATGRVDTITELPGFTRGLAFGGPFVGLSQVRLERRLPRVPRAQFSAHCVVLQRPRREAARIRDARVTSCNIGAARYSWADAAVLSHCSLARRITSSFACIVASTSLSLSHAAKSSSNRSA